VGKASLALLIAYCLPVLSYNETPRLVTDITILFVYVLLGSARGGEAKE